MSVKSLDKESSPLKFSPTESTWLRLRSVRITPGYSRGFTQGSVHAFAEVRSGLNYANSRRTLLGLLEPHLPDSEIRSMDAEDQTSGKSNQTGAASLFQTIHSLVDALQESAGIPAVRHGSLERAERLQAAGQEIIGMSFAIASLRPESAARALVFLANLLDKVAVVPTSTLKPWVKSQVEELIAGMRAGLPEWDNNSLHLMRAAFAMQMPVSVLPTGIVQIGWGRKSRLFASTASDATPQIGVQTAQHKLGTAALLRSASIPVPANMAARDADAAVAAAERIGFPVVVKPVDRDRGEGISAYLRNEAEVRAGYAKALTQSPNVMVEKYVEGAEHRLLVVGGRLFWAFERVPAHVVSDGLSTVRQLIDKANEHRRDGLRNGLSLRRIVVDDDLLAMLRRQELSLESVAAKGAFVRLRQVPLVNDGGNVVPVFDRIHPDNAALAERAVRLVRLDIAGVDFLISDISKSWREVGGYITEINALPQFSPLSRANIYSALLSRLVDAEGRIPAALVIGDNNASLFSEIHDKLTAAGLVVGMASRDRMIIGSEELVFAAWKPVQQAIALASDPSVEAIVMFVDGTTLLREGLPLDRFDAVTIAGDQPACDTLARVLRLAVPHLKGQIIIAQDADLLRIAADVVDGSKIETASTLSDFVRRICLHLAS